MNDLISRQDAIDAMSNALIRVFPEHEDIAKKTIGTLPSAQPKKILLFSERTKIAQEFSEWCDLNHVKYRPESFLAYLIIEGYIDG